MVDLTKGSLAKHLVKMSGLMMAGMTLHMSYYLVDLYFVGRLGDDAVAAFGVSTTLTFIAFAATQVLGVGTTALVSRAVGQKDHARTRLLFNQAQGLAVLMAVVFLVVMMTLRGTYARLLCSTPQAALLAGEFLNWFIPAMALQFLMVGMGAALRGTGNFIPALLIHSVVLLANMALAPILIFGWGTGHPLGATGVGLATFISIAGGVVATALYLRRRGGPLRLVAAECQPRAAGRQILAIGLPEGLSLAVMGVGAMIGYGLVRSFGPSAQVGYAIGQRVIQTLFLPAMAASIAITSVAGQNFGAHQADRVRETYRIGMMIAIAYMALLTVICQLFPAALVQLFSHDTSVLADATDYLQVTSWCFVAAGLSLACRGMFQALGNTIPPLLTSLVPVVIPTAVVLALVGRPWFHLRAVWYLCVASVLIQTLANAAFLRRELRRKLAFAPPAASSLV